MRRGGPFRRAVLSAGLREAGAAQCGPRPSARRPRAKSPPHRELQWPTRAASARHRHAADLGAPDDDPPPRAAAAPRRRRHADTTAPLLLLLLPGDDMSGPKKMKTTGSSRRGTAGGGGGGGGGPGAGGGNSGASNHLVGQGIPSGGGVGPHPPMAGSLPGPECAGCQKPIRERFLLKALDQLWHEDCLKCACCDCRLGEVGSTLFTKANLILCKRDYLRLFGTTGLCSACNKTIPAFEMVMRARGNVYHLECFACQQCNHRFCVGDRFYLHENRILCEYDYEERMIFANMPYFGGAAGAGAGMPGPPGGPPPPGLNHHHGPGGVAAGSAAGLGGQPKRLPGPPVPGPPMAGQGGPGGPTPLPNGTTHHITADGADPLSGHPVPHSSTHSGPYGNPPQGSESMLEAK
ncbi:uncharacterized protein LOC144174916 [Haemaphysalis longicornis]